MSRIKGDWYPKNSSAGKQAELLLHGAQHGPCQLVFKDEAARPAGKLTELVFSDRIANIPRKITLSDGSVFETRENDSIDAVLEQNAHRAKNIGLIHKLESHWAWITSALVLTLLISFSFFKWGLPWSAHKLAYAIPISVTQNIGGGVLDLMDDIIFEDSTLPAERQASMRQHFRALASSLNETPGYAFHFHFRAMHDIPNAMALPSGDIIVTDKLINIAKNQAEIDAILLHEIGHVVHRHGLQQVVQSTFVAVMVAMITGDASGSNELLVAFPTFLLQSRYMRHHEADADEYAFQQMIAQNIDPKHFATIMQRMTDEIEMQESASESDENAPIPDDQGEPKAHKEFSSYFSTHPITHERIKRAMAYSAQFAQQHSEVK